MPGEEKPLRAEILTREGIAEHARTLADQHRTAIMKWGSQLLYKRFEENRQILEDTYIKLSVASLSKEVLTSGAEWLLDNYHIIQEQVKEIRRDFPPGYSRSLPKLIEGDYRNYPRVYHLALEVISHTDATIDSDLLTRFIDGYQTKAELASGELWAIPIMLRFALIENLRRLSVMIIDENTQRKNAELMIEQIVAPDELKSGTDLLLVLAAKLKENPNFLTPGAVPLMRRLREIGTKAQITLQWLLERLKEQGHDPEALARAENHIQAATQISIGNTFTSLRSIRSIDWQEWFEGVSLSHRTLAGDPSGAYSISDFTTRDLYRRRIENMGRRAGIRESVIAASAVRLATKGKERVIAEGKELVGVEIRFAHVGYYIIGKGLPELQQDVQYVPTYIEKLSPSLYKYAFPIYASAIAFVSLLLVIQLFFTIRDMGGSILLASLGVLSFVVPLIELAINLIQWATTRIIRPAPLPKLDLESQVPDQFRTIVAVQSIFFDLESLAKAIDRIEVRFLANDDPNILFALLADLPDAETESTVKDQEMIEYAEKIMTRLNERHFSTSPGRFFLFFRKRVWNPSEKKFMGWERKRGKVAEFNRFILGDDTTTLNIHVGDPHALRTIKYIITLDSDSRLPKGVARKLIGTLAHPLNRAVFNQNTGIVEEGYGIVQPRVGTTLLSARSTLFSVLFSGHAGLDPYTQTVSDVYQDLFHEGSFVGKGIYDVEAFEKSLHNRVPENALLSHDLFEGCFARVALATDIEIFDDFPATFQAFSNRQHRWVRGDWQLLPWISRVIPDCNRKTYPSPLSALDRWKLIDNLRRSLVAPSCFFFLCLALIALPSEPLLWLITVTFVIAFPIYSNLASNLATSLKSISLKSYLRYLIRDLLKPCGQALFSLSLLPYQTYLMFHAIVVTLYRVYVSRSNLLEWQVAYYVDRKWKKAGRSLLGELGPGIFLALIVTVFIVVYAPDRLAAASPLLILWASSPVIVKMLNAPRSRVRSKILPSDQKYLHEIGWKTWSYFNQFMNSEHNYLIPDNIQLEPSRVIAERTSPTNISLAILSTLSAYDLGYLPQISLITRVEKTFATLKKLERFHGHFFNWYQTKTLAPLEPRYVSSVDSGNLLGHLIAARSAFSTLAGLPLLSIRHWEHLTHRVTQLRTHLAFRGTPLRAIFDKVESILIHHNSTVMGSFRTLRDLEEVSDKLRTYSSDLPRSSEATDELLLFLGELEDYSFTKKLLEWCPLFEEQRLSLDQSITDLSEERTTIMRALFERTVHGIHNKPPTLHLLKEVTENLVALCEEIEEGPQNDTHRSANFELFRSKLEESHGIIDAVISSVQSLELQSRAIVEEVDMSFLYDSSKKLFSIGYHVDSGRRDNSFYDLLASESRLGSFVAIATGQVPQKHWFSLGRSLVDSLGGTALVSWTATMFEYLMPLLVMRNYEGTLLSETYRAVLLCQQRYAEQNDVPWGISESAYSAVDFEKTYQYKAFGVPTLGLKRGLAEDLVISPYSTFLALMIDAVPAVKNLRRLERDGMRGEFGFYEAVDYTSTRLSSEENCHIIRSFLAHHQGMSLIAINNVLNHDIMQTRFHADPAVRATDLLIQEKFPEVLTTLLPNQASTVISTRETSDEEQRVSRGEFLFSPHSHYPHTRVLSNGRHTVMLDNAGNGFSIVDRDLALTRWREDGISGQYGTYIFIRDLDDGKLWSVAYQPTRVEPESYEVLFNPDKIEFKRRDFGIYLHTEITVSPEDNVELRRVTLTNISNRKRNIEITSFGEVALTQGRADIAHPAFAKMFIESEYLEDVEGLIFSRRPRSVHEEHLFLMHTVTMKTVWEKTQFETSRFKFLRRGRTVGSPGIFSEKSKLRGTLGPVLDPIFSLRTRVELEEGESTAAVFSTGFAKSREEIITLAKRYHDPSSTTRAFEMAWSQSNIELRHEQFSIRQSHTFQRLITAILFNISEVRGARESISNNRLTQSGLWRFGVSGDLPIVLIRVNDPSQIRVVKELLLAHQYIRMRGISFDLVILNDYPGGYFQNFQEELDFAVRSGYSGTMVDKKGGVYLRTGTQLSREESLLLEAIARVVLLGAKGSLSRQLRFSDRLDEVPLRKRASGFKTDKDPTKPKKNPAPQVYEFFNGIGGFVDHGKAYQLELAPPSSHRSEKPELPPLPWSNVIANPEFGFLVTESGGGYTWSENSRENRLTPWSNDPISDPLGEVIYIRDIERGTYWCPTPKPLPLEQKCRVRHGFGYSEFETEQQGIGSFLTISGSPTEKVKWWNLKLTNTSAQERRLEAYLYLDWTLGISRDESARHLVSTFDSEGNFLWATNHYNNEFSSRTVHMGANLKIQSFTTNRHEFVGRNRDVSSPRALDLSIAPNLTSIFSPSRAEVELSREVGSGFDSCGVIKVEVNLAPGQQREVLFYLAEAPTLSEAKREAPRFRSLEIQAVEQKKSTAYWDAALTTIQVKTPDRAFDILTNGWFLYQNLSCRIHGRSGFYQSGGAIGFRDQLQDSMALLFSRPDMTRAQILLHASRQFPEGDVQHWWHPPVGKGVRTKISDDYLWLPYAVSRYIDVTGDTAILDEKVPFIDGPLLEDGRMEAYLLPLPSTRSASLYEHCTVALERALSAVGPHHLPLMGGGDWNDGMNEVGREGKGESVWLAWFLSDCLKKFAPIARIKNDHKDAARYESHAHELVRSIDSEAWDGAWYRRAYFDNGAPLGSKGSDECKIDSIAQSWSVIAGGGDKARSELAMESARRELVKTKEKIILLLTPPFNRGSLEPGYIKGYVPGIRENGGQYTHAACWMIMATALQGKGEIASELFTLVNPINHTLTLAGVERYMGEPYVLCGDVYGGENYAGRAGWSWYTGSAGWMYQVAIGSILGLSVKSDHFTINPCIPPSWKCFSLTYTAKNVRYEITVENPTGVEQGIGEITINGAKVPDNKIPLKVGPERGNEIVTILVTMNRSISTTLPPSNFPHAPPTL